MSKLLMYEAELQDVKNEMDRLTQSNVSKEDDRYRAQENREAELLQLVMEEEKAVAIITNVQDPDSSFGIAVQGMTVNFREVTDKEESYQALAIAYQLKLQEIEDNNQAEIKAIKSSYESERQQYESQLSNIQSVTNAVQEAFSASNQTIIRLSEQLADAAIQIKDLEGKRDIAANEAESLRTTVEELRNQVSKPTVATNLDNNALAEAMEKLKASRPAIYNVVEVSGTKSTAIQVDTNETIEFHPNYIGKYRVVSYEEAMQIRNEIERALQEEASNVPGSPEPVELVEEQFRQELELPVLTELHDGRELGGNTDTAEGVQNHDGGETFEQAVERRLAALENRVFARSETGIDQEAA